MQMGERLGQYMREHDISQAELARRSGVRQQTIQYLIKSNSAGSSYAVRLATALGVNPVWLQEGVGSPFNPTVSVGGSPGAAPAHWVPKVRSVGEMEAVLASALNAEVAVVTAAEVGSRGFALDVVGRANAPDLLDGDEVIVNPDLRPEPGELVAAVVGEDLVVRKWRPLPFDGTERFELVAANPDFPAILSAHQPARVVGVVVEHRRRLRR